MMPEVHTEVSARELAHTFEEQVPEVDLRSIRVRRLGVCILFWMMAFAVFLQFFTRYVLNDSLAWTEEIATYCLVAVVFVGSAMCVRLGRHIQVDLIFRYLPPGVARVLSTAIDVIRTIFFAYAAYLVWQFMKIVEGETDDHNYAAEESDLRLRFYRLPHDARQVGAGICRKLAPWLLDSRET